MSAKPEGGRGPLSRGWYFPDQCPAQLLAFVALDTDTAWLFTLKEAQELAQQHSRARHSPALLASQGRSGWTEIAAP